MFLHTETNDKFYRVVEMDGTVRQVRRDTYHDTGFKSPVETKLIDEIEAHFEENAVPSIYLLGMEYI